VTVVWLQPPDWLGSSISAIPCGPFASAGW
jgi:hypothetical protein